MLISALTLFYAEGIEIVITAILSNDRKVVVACHFFRLKDNIIDAFIIREVKIKFSNISFQSCQNIIKSVLNAE